MVDLFRDSFKVFGFTGDFDMPALKQQISLNSNTVLTSIFKI